MNNSSTFENKQQDKLNQQQGFDLDPMVIFSLITKNWYWFIIGIIIAFFGARFYIGHTMPVFRTSASLLINETEERQIVDNTELLQGLGLPGGMRNLENQIMILRSRALTESTLKEFSFEMEYYFKTIRNRLPIYPETPISIVSDHEMPLPKDKEFSITFLGSNMITLESESDSYTLQRTASFGDTIAVQDGVIQVLCQDNQWLKLNSERKLYFMAHSINSLTDYFNNRLDIEKVSRDGSVLRISMVGTNKDRDGDFINELLEGFQAISLNRKNIEAERRIAFIDDQLIGISDSLSMTENKLQQFRSSHRVMDLSAQGQALIGQVTLLENEKARLDLEANYYDYLGDYLAKNESGEIPIVPITMGITDAGLTRLVNELAELQGQLLARGAGEMNPLQRNLEQKVRMAKDALRETLNGLKRANSLARSENQQQINRVNTQASALPVTERQLLGIERKFQLNNELYTFLLETRANLQMQKASNRADSEVIDHADERFSVLISPNQARIKLVALFAGFAIPFLIIYLNFIFNKKLKYEDINKISDLPVVGHIPHNTEKTNTVVFNNPNSTISEAFRLLRSRMQFFTKEARSPIILVTSSMPDDGKTFTAINLASVYSLLGKRTILVGFDLRKPKIYQDFNLSNEKGVSTWLIGKDSFEDLLQETSFKNLSIIPAGPIPPNPSELTALEKTAELFRLLKERYDCIVIDSSPIGVVSDTFHLASLADASIFVVRPGQTTRDILINTLTEIHSNGILSASIVINDIQLKDNSYSYGGKYGYTVDKKQSKKYSLKGKILKRL